MLSSAIILTLGSLVLSLFVPGKNAFMIGVLPFLPGDALKSTTTTLLLQHYGNSFQEMINKQIFN